MTGELLSADSHVVETADFWTRHIDADFLDRAPTARDEDGKVMFYVDGDLKLGSVGAASQAGLRFDAPEDITFEGSWEDVRPGCAEPNARLEDMARDGVKGEVIFPTLGARLYGVIEGELLNKVFAAGNSWMMETFGAEHAKVFKPVACLNVADPEGAAAELRRCVEGGLAGGMIPTYPGEENPYYNPALDVLWATAEELEAPLAFHIASCCKGPSQLSVFTGDWQKPGAAAYSVTQDHWVRRSVGEMIFHGVFERFPGLRVSIVEHELAWLPYFLTQMDFHYKELSQTAPYRFKGETLPSDFFRNQIFTTFQEDAVGLKVLPEMIGTDTLMFGSDYPHAESTWPHSKRYLDDLISDMPAETQRKLVHDNVAGLFKFDTA